MKKNKVTKFIYSGLLLIMLLVLFPVTLSAQNKMVIGKVVDSTNEPIIGASVLEKGTQNGTITDIDGKFELSVALGKTLTISYIGYQSQDVKVTDTNITIILKEDTKTLDEVVVVGYGVQKKSVVTAAISKVTAEELNSAKPSRVEDALKGKVSGVQITQRDRKSVV